MMDDDDPYVISHWLTHHLQGTYGTPFFWWYPQQIQPTVVTSTAEMVIGHHFVVPSRALRYQWCMFCNLAGRAKPTIDHDVFLKDDNIGIAHKKTIFDDPRVPIYTYYTGTAQRC